jgi:tetratricopeptide (TPR) repeat protein
MVLLEPHTYYSTKCSLLAIKWCVKKRYFEEATKIFEMKEMENIFWQGEYNPAITEFYDFFSMFYAQNGQYDHSVSLARMSLKNIMKVSGPSALPVADKHYQLGNIYFKMGKKEEALKEYSRTKDILQAHNQTHIPEHGVILLKLAVLYLNFGKIP